MAQNLAGGDVLRCVSPSPLPLLICALALAGRAPHHQRRPTRFDPNPPSAFSSFDSPGIEEGVLDMSEQVRMLHDILVLCVLRYGQTQDSRFALAALVAYQSLPGVIRSEAMDYVEMKLSEIQDRIVATIPRKSDVSTLASFIRSTGLAEALKSEKAAQFGRYRASLSLRKIAPELANSIETYDLRAAYSFKPEPASTSAA